MRPSSKPRLVRQYGDPYGIRDDDGFLLFFPAVQHFTFQDERYVRELAEQEVLAQRVLTALWTDHEPR